MARKLSILKRHDICPTTGFCRRCGAYLDIILMRNWDCLEGVSAISHIRAAAIAAKSAPTDFPLLNRGDKAKPGTFYDAIVLECIAEHVAKSKMASAYNSV